MDERGAGAEAGWRGTFSVMLLQRYVAMIERDYAANVSSWFTFENGLVKKVYERRHESVEDGKIRFVHPEDADMVNSFHDPDTVRREYAGGLRQKALEYRRLADDGKVIYVRADMYIFEDEGGALKSQTYIEDITESKKARLAVSEARRAQRQLELKFVSLIKNNYIKIYEAVRERDSLAEYELSGDGLLSTRSLPLGWKRGAAELVARVAHPEDRAAYLAFLDADSIVREIEENGKHPFHIYRRSDGSGGWLWCRTTVRGYRDEDGDFHLIICVQDVDAELREREKAADELRRAYAEARRRAKELEGVGQMFSTIYRLDAALGRLECVHLSPEERELNPGGLPRRLEDILSDVHGEDREAAAFLLTAGKAESGKKAVRELDLRLKSARPGGYAWARMSLISLPEVEGHGAEAFVTMQDIHERKTREVELKTALETALNSARQANEAKTNFLSNMSHDIRTPMNAIIGLINIAETHLDEPERVRDCLKKISVSASHLLGIINDVLDMSRIESGKMTIAEEAVDLSELIHRLITIIQPQIKSKDQKLIVDTSSIRNESVISDNTRLMQIFLNILSNAAKFTPSGGTLEIRISQLPSARAGFGTYQFVFADNGIGMSRDFLSRLFMPFERAETGAARTEGTGLGMTITKSIVDMMGGTISCRSELGAGTTFTVTLDLRLQDENGCAYAPDEFAGLHALVVDDDEKTCENLSQLLEEAGMSCEWTLFGKEAVARAEMMHRRGKPFKLYLIDWLMPDMNGIETTRRIRRSVGGDAPIFILTAYDWSDIEEEAREAGVTAFLSKPLFRSNLYHTLRQASRGAGQGSETGGRAGETSRIAEGKRILLAEDNEINTEIAVELLSQAGAEVVPVRNGREAVEALAGSPEGYFDLVLMDIQMPVMNGYDAAGAIRSLGRRDAAELPIYAMTANVFDEDIRLAFEAGMDGHVGKPIDAGELYALLRERLK